MKLWKKISLLTAVVLFIAMGIFGGGMLYETWKYNLNQTVSSYQQQMKVNSYVIAQEINNNPLSRFSEVTRKSFLNYTVQKYGGTDYILLKNGQEVVNLTGYTLVSGEDARFNDQDPAYAPAENGQPPSSGHGADAEDGEKGKSPNFSSFL